MAVNVTKGNVITGSRVKLSIKNKAIGYATVATYVETISYDPVAVLDQMEIAEHVPVSYDVAFSASRVMILKESLKAVGLMPKFGANSAEFLTNLLADKNGMDATIQDAQGQLLVKLTGVKVASHNLTFGARAAVGEDVAFVAIRAVDGQAVGDE